MNTLMQSSNTVGDTGTPFSSGATGNMSVTGYVVGTGAVSATVILEGSNNNIDWITVATLTMSGTTRAADGGVLNIVWDNLRARLTAISGTSAAVTVECKSRSANGNR